MPKRLVLETEKTVQQTLSDLGKLFKEMGLDEWMPVPDEAGPAYTIKFMWNKKWVPIRSELQPTKAGNIRMCFRAVNHIWEMQSRGITGVVSQAITEMGLVAVSAENVLDEDYALLGLDNNASIDKIQDAYRKKSKKYHPDVKGAGDADIFKSVDRAYKRLMASKGQKG